MSIFSASSQTQAPTPEQAASIEGNVDYVRTGPGSLCGAYLRSFWQPVYIGSELAPGRSVAITIMSQNLALYRSQEGSVHCVDNRCAHRGVVLSAGWVEGDVIRCPYHGWAFGADGQCVDQPLEHEGFAKKVKIGGYPTREYLGLIFVFLGEGEPREFPSFPEWDRADYVAPVMEVRHCNWFQNVENFQDEAHVWFTHLGSALNKLDLSKLPRLTYEKTSWGLANVATTVTGQRRITLFGMPNMGMFMVPSIVITAPAPNVYETGWQTFLDWRVPIDDESHFQVHAIMVSLKREADDEYLKLWENRRNQDNHERARVVAEKVRIGQMPYNDIPSLKGASVPFAQDDVTQVGQGVYANRTKGIEHLGVTDAGVLAIRRMYREELTALAEGRPLRDWVRPEGLLPRSGDEPDKLDGAKPNVAP